MEMLQKLEANLVSVFDKKAPYQLPQNVRKSLAGAMWWLALIFGALQLWSAWSLWQLGHATNRIVDYANQLSAAYGSGEIIQHLGFFYYLSLVVLAFDAVLVLMAVPALKEFKKRRGWNFLYYSMVINLIYGVIRGFSDVGGGFGQLVWSLIVSALGAYFLFQIRSYFMGRKADKKVGVEKTTLKTVR